MAKNELLWKCGKCGDVTPRDARTQAEELSACSQCGARDWRAVDLTQHFAEQSVTEIVRSGR